MGTSHNWGHFFFKIDSVLFPVDESKGSVSRTEQSKNFTMFRFLNSTVGIEPWGNSSDSRPVQIEKIGLKSGKYSLL